MTGRAMANLKGHRFGNLVVLSLSHKERREYSYGWMTIVFWNCQCDCGGVRTIPTARLRSGASTSCGCAKSKKLKEAHTIHGGTNKPEYRVWSHIKGRCNNPKDKAFRNYGGRGVMVCDRWNDSFEAFLEDVGERPTSRHQLDRTNNNGNYEPGNVRWVLPSVNCRNKRNNCMLTYMGSDRTLAEWAEIVPSPYGTIASRMRKGWPPEEVLFGRIKF